MVLLNRRNFKGPLNHSNCSQINFSLKILLRQTIRHPEEWVEWPGHCCRQGRSYKRLRWRRPTATLLPTVKVHGSVPLPPSVPKPLISAFLIRCHCKKSLLRQTVWVKDCLESVKASEEALSRHNNTGTEVSWRGVIYRQ